VLLDSRADSLPAVVNAIRLRLTDCSSAIVGTRRCREPRSGQNRTDAALGLRSRKKGTGVGEGTYSYGICILGLGQPGPRAIVDRSALTDL
jgi:hypothetical protein